MIKMTKGWRSTALIPDSFQTHSKLSLQLCFVSSLSFFRLSQDNKTLEIKARKSSGRKERQILTSIVCMSSFSSNNFSICFDSLPESSSSCCWLESSEITFFRPPSFFLNDVNDDDETDDASSVFPSIPAAAAFDKMSPSLIFDQFFQTVRKEVVLEKGKEV